MRKRVVACVLMACMLVGCGVGEKFAPPSESIIKTPVLAVPLPAQSESSSLESSILMTPVVHQSKTPDPLELTLDSPDWPLFPLSTTLTVTSTTNLRLLNWSPSGQQLLFVRGDTLWVLDATNSQYRELLSHITAAVWSPDGSSIAFIQQGQNDPVSNSTLWTFVLNTGLQHKIGAIPGSMPPNPYLTWTAEKGILVATDEAMLQFYDTTKLQAPTVIFTIPDMMRTQSARVSNRPALSLSPNGHTAILSDGKPYQPQLHFLTNGAVTAVMSVTEYTDSIWTEDGAMVAFHDSPETFRICDVHGQTLYRTQIERLNQFPLAWSPDKNFLVYKFNEGGSSPHNAYIAKINGHGSQMLNEQPMSYVDGGGSVLQVRWSSNNKYIAYVLYRSNPDHQITFEFVLRVIID